MSRSTTSRLSFLLKKYSRSSLKAGILPSDIDWQHFTQPRLRLNLDITKSLPADTLEAVELKIIWEVAYDGSTLDSDQPDVPLENLDLLAFSRASSSDPGYNLSVQSPPLKAIYRDSIVALRYLFQKNGISESFPAFRRFQVIFASSEDALQFINMIRPVCPCQVQGAPVPVPLPHTAATASISSTQHPLSRPATATPTTAGNSTPKSVNPQPKTSSLDYWTPSQVSSTSKAKAASSSDPLIPLSSPNFNSSSQPQSTSSNYAIHSSDLEARRSSSVLQSAVPAYTHSTHAALSMQGSLMPPPPAPTSSSSAIAKSYPADQVNQPTSVQPSSIAHVKTLPAEPTDRDRTLYELSHKELATLVGQVLREPDFMRVVRALEDVWDAKVHTDWASDK